VFERVGPRAVAYSVVALDSYLATRRATSTSEPVPQEQAALATPNHAPAGAAAPKAAGGRATDRRGPGKRGQRRPRNPPL
jgi:hypothetical protein